MKTPALPKTNSMDRLFTVQVWVRRLIAFLFAVFLIGLSTAIMKDLNKVERMAQTSDYYTPEYKELEKKINVLNEKNIQLSNTLRLETDELRTRKQQTASYQAEFKNWTELRSATENKDTNPEVREKLQVLDSKREAERKQEDVVHRIDQEYKAIQKELNSVQAQANSLQFEFGKKAAEANKWVSLKIFGIRLLFTLPVLAIGVFAFVKYRTHQYAPLVWGYVWFSLYVFFVGLVPYLPSFGGYVRYIVGIILVVFGGIYAIRSFNSYMERRKLELEKNKELRAKQIDSDNAIVSFKNHVCPSCGQDYLLGDGKDADVRHCFHCGLELFRKCECGKVNFAFFKYCSCCGKTVKPDENIN